MRFFALACALVACSAAAETSRTRTVMTDNKQLVRRLYDEMVNPNQLDHLGDIISDDLPGPNGTRGPAGFAQTVRGLRAAFPDLHYALEDVVGDGDRVAIRWTLRGTHTGELRGLPPSGKTVVNDGVAFFRFADGKIVQATVITDRLGFLMAVGRIPYDPTFGAPPRTE